MKAMRITNDGIHCPCHTRVASYTCIHVHTISAKINSGYVHILTDPHPDWTYPYMYCKLHVLQGCRCRSHSSGRDPQVRVFIIVHVHVTAMLTTTNSVHFQAGWTVSKPAGPFQCCSIGQLWNGPSVVALLPASSPFWSQPSGSPNTGQYLWWRMHYEHPFRMSQAGREAISLKHYNY